MSNFINLYNGMIIILLFSGKRLFVHKSLLCGVFEVRKKRALNFNALCSP